MSDFLSKLDEVQARCDKATNRKHAANCDKWEDSYAGKFLASNKTCTCGYSDLPTALACIRALLEENQRSRELLTEAGHELGNHFSTSIFAPSQAKDIYERILAFLAVKEQP